MLNTLAAFLALTSQEQNCPNHKTANGTIRVLNELDLPSLLEALSDMKRLGNELFGCPNRGFLPLARDIDDIGLDEQLGDTIFKLRSWRC